MYASRNLFFHADRACRAGTLSLTCVSELPLRLLICSTDLFDEYKLVELEFATILSLLMARRAYGLVQALLASCSKTEKPGIVTLNATTQSSITFDIDVDHHQSPSRALLRALYVNEIGIARQLLHLGVAADAPGDKHKPLLLAISTMRKDLVELLLRCGAEVNAVSRFAPHMTSLIVAADTDYYVGRLADTVRYDIVAILLAYGADLHYRDEQGTALDHALRRRRTKLARLLWDAQFPNGTWEQTRPAHDDQTKEYWDDTATVHDIRHHAGSDSDTHSYSNMNSNVWDSDDSDKSIVSARTV